MHKKRLPGVSRQSLNILIITPEEARSQRFLNVSKEVLPYAQKSQQIFSQHSQLKTGVSCAIV
jgi:hypothetical protein